MSVPTPPGPSAAHPARNVPTTVFAALGALATALVAAFVVAPRLVANASSPVGFADESELVRSFGAAFVGYWTAGRAEFTPELAAIVDYWQRYHVAKGVLAGALAFVLTVLTVALWREFVRRADADRDDPDRNGTALLATACTATGAGALFSGAVVVANLQGTLEPFASLLSFAPAAREVSGVGPIVDLAGRDLDEGALGAAPLRAMLDTFSAYHVVVAIAAGVALAAACAAVVAARVSRARNANRRIRRAWTAVTGAAVATAAATLVLGLANTSVAADPVTGLAGLLSGAVL